jgi:hypothetical protein
MPGAACQQLMQPRQLTGGILQGVTDSVTDDGSLVAVRALSTKLTGVLRCTSLHKGHMHTNNSVECLCCCVADTAQPLTRTEHHYGQRAARKLFNIKQADLFTRVATCTCNLQ